MASFIPRYLISVGSVARGAPTFNDFDFITTKPLDYVRKDLEKRGEIKFMKGGERYMQVNFDGMIFDIWHVEKNEVPYVQLMRSLSPAQAIAIYSIAKKKGIEIKTTGLFKDGKQINIP